MSTFEVVLFFIGLSLDGYVAMMNKAATIRGLTVKKGALYALICAAVNTAAVALGFLFSLLFLNGMESSMRVEVACLILFAIGMYVIIRAYKYPRQEERLDKDFDYKHCFALAAGTSLDSLFMAVAFSMFGISFATGISLSFIITWIATATALYIGYTRGSGYTRAVGMSGGALMICLSVYLQVVYVFLK